MARTRSYVSVLRAWLLAAPMVVGAGGVGALAQEDTDRNTNAAGEVSIMAAGEDAGPAGREPCRSGVRYP